ncbi:uncharacterized protein FOMMEDRAFT_131472 [Fomitiporia mediterranea MF3/22]|uniref:uncharacterized protein n=1 Tax=Fomitiporia mediterranea (strain MF3/22) TaxID=694068 RepID=UPI0004409715|nr:uncharacterized protein FOMMEDRAFT_131472 [Fomitiporia mediterranea MF3/22]EJD06560.1 hypothetical protein FOMMEDRAFT_131472 [Fomitiporia mediterranea MF3/22]
MPAKYSHAKKRLNARDPARKNGSASSNNKNGSMFHGHAHRNPNPHLERSISQTMNATITAVSELERAISRILLLRYEHDICRLYSTRLHNIALIYVPKLVLDCIDLTSPGWVAANADCDEIKDFFRGAIAMDLRQAGERVATKSVLWSYTALRHFALSNNVPICQKRGLHSLRLLPHFQGLRAHLDVLEAMPIASFAKPTHLPSLDEGLELIEDDLSRKKNKPVPAWDDWRLKLRIGYERLVDTLWQVSKEFDIRGYGNVLREKLTTKWCDCGCSTDHLGEVCERTVREEEEESGIRSGKGREWDGRGSGVYGWQTEDEEDVWDMELDFGGIEPDECDGLDPEMTIGELMEWRYFKAEKAKELGNKAFRNGDFETAIKQYSSAYDIEPELPHYQLNLAAAHLKLSNWIAAEKACNKALAQHRSGKGYWRRAKARRMQGRTVEAVKDLRNVLKIQPGNTDALTELMSIMPSAAADMALRARSRSPSPGFSSSSNAPSASAGSSSGGDSSVNGSGSGSGSGSGCGNGSSSKNALHSPPTTSTSADTSTTNGNTNTNFTTNLPFQLSDLDTRKLRLYTQPLQVEMPIINGSGASKGGNRKGKENGGSGGGGGPTFEIQLETYTYPTWDRCKVQHVSR